MIAAGSEPDRIGEVLFLPRGRSILGRHDPEDAPSAEPMLVPVRQRPGGNEATSPLLLPLHVSRRQIEIVSETTGPLTVVRLGKAPVFLNGSAELAPGESAPVQPGDTLRIGSDLILQCVLRPSTLPPSRFLREEFLPPFGKADPFGMVGESPSAWELRDRIAFVAGFDQHVLVTGATGTGKALVARAIHGMSSRRDRSLVVHSMADIPESIAEAELFGNRKDYPNPGTPGREGLLGAADGTTLFLDELGAVPVSIHAKLLRVLDDGGGYRRLGEDEPCRSDLRLIAATNSEPSALKFDLLARLKLTVEVPSLVERLDDVPLLARHLLQGLRSRQRDVSPPRISVELIEQLVWHTFPANVRELESLLLAGLYGGVEQEVALTDEVRSRLRPDRETSADPESLPCAEVEAALQAGDWNVSRTARQLGWSRDQLNRRMKKCGIRSPHPPASR